MVVKNVRIQIISIGNNLQLHKKNAKLINKKTTYESK